jgi:hypothetical protein
VIVLIAPRISLPPAKRFDCLTGNDVGPNGRLDCDIELLPRNDLAHFGHHCPPAVGRLAAVDDDGQCVDLLAVQQDVDLDHVGCPELLELVIHGRITA